MKRKAEVLKDDPQEDSDSASESETSSSGTSGASDAGGSSDSESEQQGDVDVDFEFFDPQDIDFHGLKALLQTYLDGNSFSSSELVETIIQQKTVGTVVKTTDSVDPIAILTVLPLERYTSLACLKEIKSYLESRCTGKIKQQLQQTWDNAHCGLLISERLVNCPPQLAPPLNQALFEEVAWAQEDEPTQVLRDSFKLQHYILVTRVFTDPSVKPVLPSTPKTKTKEPIIVYARPEDEFYHKHCSWSYTFPVSKQEVEKDELQPLRMVLAVTPEQITRARSEMDQVVGNAAS